MIKQKLQNKNLDKGRGHRIVRERSTNIHQLFENKDNGFIERQKIVKNTHTHSYIIRMSL